ncbi:MAG: hypothetical protein GY737_19685, partial [Desulfobacteraceae bacterium]|nr:hypothetical protein [Desulfobacteraceae bacterium]
DQFQSELFPDALVTWEPTVNANEWLAGCDVNPKFQSLRPANLPSSKDG